LEVAMATEIWSFDMDQELHERLLREARITGESPDQIAELAIARYLEAKKLERQQRGDHSRGTE
jgi:predicted transcriptional regulator